MPKRNTLIIPIIRGDLLQKCLETLYKYTEPDTFYVYVVDQTPSGIDRDIIKKYVHMYLKPHRNLGFAKACNEAIKLVETPYFTLCNDDVEFIGDWFPGVVKTFEKIAKATPERPAIIVTPSSVKLPYWSIGQEKDFEIIPYKEYTKEDYDYLLNNDHKITKTFTIAKDTVIDGITMYCSVFDTAKVKEIGLLDEKYYPGAGEDYDYCCRANMLGYRCVGTTWSWVYHHWGKSFKYWSDNIAKMDNSLAWNNNSDKWGEGFDIWGVKCPFCGEAMRTVVGNIATCSKQHTKYKMPPTTKVNL